MDNTYFETSREKYDSIWKCSRLLVDESASIIGDSHMVITEAQALRAKSQELRRRVTHSLPELRDLSER